MRCTTTLLAALLLAGSGCKKKDEAKPETTAKVEAPKPDKPAENPNPEKPANPPAGQKKLFIDVHELGAGKVKAADVAEAHKKDLATQGKHGVEFKAYWVDEAAGTVYCLSESPSAEASTAVHKEAHGLIPVRTLEVTGDSASWTPTAGKHLYMDVHELGAGKVKSADVAEAHKKDLAVQSKHNASFLNYWVDEASGTVFCLSEAEKPEDVVATHKEAHGLIPKSVAMVSEGR